MDWDKGGYVMSSKIRYNILISLKKSVETPTSLSTKNNIHISAVSRALRELKEKNLVQCLNKGRESKRKYYALTEEGLKIIEKINNETSK